MTRADEGREEVTVQIAKEVEGGLYLVTIRSSDLYLIRQAKITCTIAEGFDSPCHTQANLIVNIDMKYGIPLDATEFFLQAVQGKCLNSPDNTGGTACNVSPAVIRS